MTWDSFRPRQLSEPGEPATPDPATARSRKWLIVGGAFLAALLLLGAYRWNASAGAKARRPSPPASLTVAGTITVSEGHTGTDPAKTPDVGDPCYTTDGYDDIRDGTQVVVSDAHGTTLAVGALSTGTVPAAVSYFGSSGPCEFEFSLNDVPAGKKFYKVAVGHRGEQTYSEAAVQQPITLELGSS